MSLKRFSNKVRNIFSNITQPFSPQYNENLVKTDQQG